MSLIARAHTWALPLSLSASLRLDGVNKTQRILEKTRGMKVPYEEGFSGTQMKGPAKNARARGNPVIKRVPRGHGGDATVAARRTRAEARDKVTGSRRGKTGVCRRVSAGVDGRRGARLRD